MPNFIKLHQANNDSFYIDTNRIIRFYLDSTDGLTTIVVDEIRSHISGSTKSPKINIKESVEELFFAINAD